MILFDTHSLSSNSHLILRTMQLPSKIRPCRQATNGFTLIELLAVTVVLGVLSAVAVPVLANNIERARVAATASEMKSFADGIYTYALLTGAYPNDSHNAIPPGTEGYINDVAFLQDAPIGGRYNWEGTNSIYDYVGVALDNSPAPNNVLVMLDEALDDGNLTSGRFRNDGPSGRPTLIVEECGTGLAPAC